jgi:opacity protein-like surface antigen
MTTKIKLIAPLIAVSVIVSSVLHAEVLVYENLHLRKKPSIKSPILGKIKKDSIVFLNADKNQNRDWLKTSKGYIYKKYTSKLYGVVAVNSILNIREKPSIKSKIIGQYSDNKLLPIFKEAVTDNGKWYQTDKGWIYSKYIILSNSFKILDGKEKNLKTTVVKVDKTSKVAKPKKKSVAKVNRKHEINHKAVSTVKTDVAVNKKHKQAKKSANIYVDVGYSIATYSKNGTKSDFHPKDYKLDIGYIFADLDYIAFAAETGLLFNAQSDKKSEVTLLDGTTLNNAKVTLDKLYYLELKAIIPLFDQLNANVYAGGNQVKMLTSGDGYKGSNDWDYGFAYGAGLEYVFKNNISLHTDYMIYFTNIKAIDFGLGYRF